MTTAPDLLAYDGGAIKATANADGTVTLEGLCVIFDEPGTGKADLTGEYFTSSTYYGAGTLDGAAVVDGMFHHGQPLDDSPEALALAEAILPPVALVRDTKGWLARLVLPMREEYERDIADLAAKGKLGWSTGSAGHAVRKSADGRITRWPIVEVSLTPTPAEPRTYAVPAKSLAPRKALDFSAGMNALRERVHSAARALFPGADYVWVADLFPDACIVEIEGGESYRIPVEADAERVVFGERTTWQAVERVTAWSPVAKALKHFNDSADTRAFLGALRAIGPASAD